MSIEKMTYATVFLAAFGWASSARAVEPAEPCGGVIIDEIESCEVVDERCWEWCTPRRSMLACVAEQSETCELDCQAEAEASPHCVSSCQQSCELECSNSALPGEPGRSCDDSCNAQCNANSAQACANSEFPELCELARPFQCASRCDDACGEDTGECELSCESACAGSCAASASSSCELDCQAEAELECTERAADTCHERCLGGGVLFCEARSEAHYVETGEDPLACVGALVDGGVEIAGAVERLDRRGASEVSADGCSVHERASVGLSVAVSALFGFGFGTLLLHAPRRE